MRVIDRTGFNLLMTELRVGTTLARSASFKRNPDRRARTIHTARHAYDTSVLLAAKLQLAEAQQRDFNRKMEKLKAALEQLGEVF
jgi:hypothetical protein